jgi:acetylornithine/succinyldiaminopimelate/putrescine aminotransferase
MKATNATAEDLLARKKRAIDEAVEFVCPGKVQTFKGMGIDLVVGRREGPYIYNVDGRQLIDCHINGGTYNLGHRNPELIAVLQRALETLDIGNHHFPSEARNQLAKTLSRLTPGDLHYTVYSSGGGEAIDLAIKSARYATGRRRIVAADKGYHGRTGLSGAAGDDAAARYFHSEPPEGDFVKVPFNDLEAVEKEFRSGEIAAVLMETIPATLGFPMPAPGYLTGIKALCEQHGALYIADEVQTGLGRTGSLWAIEGYGVEPDILVTAKGLSGGLYPIAATVIAKRHGGWLKDNGFAHVSTFGGSEVGCVVAHRVLEICSDPAVLENVRVMSDYLGAALEAFRETYPSKFLEIRRNGLVMGLKFAGPIGAALMSKALYDSGIWAMFSGFDLSVLQFKPILLIDRALADQILERFETALKKLPG